MNFLVTILFLILRFFVVIIPFRVLYVFSDLLLFLLEKVFKYRKEVIKQNLELSFPNLTDKEIKKLIHLSYKNISDVILEGIKAFAMTNKQIIKRHKILNPEIIEHLFNLNRSVISVPCHYANWEWGASSPSLQLSKEIFVFYKPLSNKHIDRYIRNIRSKGGGKLLSIYNTARVFENNADSVVGYVMAADQSPSNSNKAYWVNFLGRETAFLHGPEFYARKHDISVVFIDTQRVKRGYYEITCSVIADNPKKMADGEITALYARKLEEAILKKPEDWLWSHRRWKLIRDPSQKLFRY
ncbi:MAG: lysophospholipid acyltransferase family protein [Bacteroidetes bacterium]|nr:lysophospholipid acyltransferase family protein [Bacteroidota bacterium]MBL6942907.1 lysophospholipid acyltransferase family protein [Bacteroidales bacterium]